MDDFRVIQKSHCCDGGSYGKTYGCPCCRKWNVSLNKFKKLSRKIAKAKFRKRSELLISEEQNG